MAATLWIFVMRNNGLVDVVLRQDGNQHRLAVGNWDDALEIVRWVEGDVAIRVRAVAQ